MTLNSVIDYDLDNVFLNANEFGKTCTFTSFETGASTPNVPVILGIGACLTRNEDGMAEADTAYFKIGSIPAPKRNDYFVCESTKYTVMQRLQGDGMVWFLTVESDQRQNPRG